MTIPEQLRAAGIWYRPPSFAGDQSFWRGPMNVELLAVDVAKILGVGLGDVLAFEGQQDMDNMQELAGAFGG